MNSATTTRPRIAVPDRPGYKSDFLTSRSLDLPALIFSAPPFTGPRVSRGEVPAVADRQRRRAGTHDVLEHPQSPPAGPATSIRVGGGSCSATCRAPRARRGRQRVHQPGPAARAALLLPVPDDVDARFFMSSGPFMLPPGESRTIVVAYVQAAALERLRRTHRRRRGSATIANPSIPPSRDQSRDRCGYGPHHRQARPAGSARRST